MPRNQQIFEAKDVELLQKVLLLNPDLETVAYIAKLARDKITYPIKSPENLLPLFRGRSSVFVFKENKLTFKQAEKFIPKEFFPIETEDDLLRRLLIVFAIGRNSHTQDQMQTVSFVALNTEKENKPK